MPTTDAADFLRRSLAAMESADYDAWHATERLVLADALEELGDGRCAWLRGLGDVEPVFSLWHDAREVRRLSLHAYERVQVSVMCGKAVEYAGIMHHGQSMQWHLRGNPDAPLLVRCTAFPRLLRATVTIDGGGYTSFDLNRQFAIIQRRDEILATLTRSKP